MIKYYRLVRNFDRKLDLLIYTLLTPQYSIYGICKKLLKMMDINTNTCTEFILNCIFMHLSIN